MISLNHLNDRYRNHVASFQDLGSIKILDFAEPGTSMRSIRFLFNEDDYELFITGDLGHLVARNNCNMVYSKFKSDFTDTPGYFAEKVKWCEFPIYEYDKEAAESHLKHNLCICGYAGEDTPKLYKAVDDILTDFDSRHGLSEYGRKRLIKIDHRAEYTYETIGRISSGQLEFYLALFKLAQSKLPDAKP